GATRSPSAAPGPRLRGGVEPAAGLRPGSGAPRPGGGVPRHGSPTRWAHLHTATLAPVRSFVNIRCNTVSIVLLILTARVYWPRGHRRTALAARQATAGRAGAAGGRPALGNARGEDRPAVPRD